MRPCSTFLLAAVLFVPASARAQEAAPPPAHLGVVDGAATVARDGQVEEALAGLPLIEGDSVETGAGRVEIVLADGSGLYLDAGSTVDLLSFSLFRLLEGRATLFVSGESADAAAYRIDTPAASVRIERAGEYRVASFPSGLEAQLAVVQGIARFETEAGSVLVRAGERTTARPGEAPVYPQAFNSARTDDFDRWVDGRQEGRTASLSRDYLPTELQTYAASFDRYGTWSSLPDYGTVWYPTSAAPGWQPYYNGYWRDIRPYGWTWVGYDPWSWPTHHFGRWGFHRGSWFWIPGRVWGPAWVSWAISPGFVSWCPLGFNGRAVFGFWDHRISGFHRRGGWTFVPRHSFGHRTHVSRVAIDGRTMLGDRRTAFVVQHVAPPTRVAIPRAGVSARVSPVLPRVTRSARTAGGDDGRRTVVRGGAVGVAVPRPGASAGLGTAAGVGAVTSYPYVARPATESPYARAARVAGERRSGVGRQPLGPGGSAPAQTNPYPPQYRSAVPEPFRSPGRFMGTTPFEQSPAGVWERRGAGIRTAPVARPRTSGSAASAPSAGSQPAPQSSQPAARRGSAAGARTGGVQPRTAVPRNRQ